MKSVTVDLDHFQFRNRASAIMDKVLDDHKRLVNDSLEYVNKYREELMKPLEGIK